MSESWLSLSRIDVAITHRYEFLEAKDIKEKPVSESYIKRVINLTKNDKFKENPGLQHWGISHNNLAISQTIYRLHQLGIGSFKQLENYISQTTLSVENDRKELEKLEKKAMELLEKRDLLNELENIEMENEVSTTIELSLTSDKTNMRLENILQSLKFSGLFLENRIQLHEVISETDDLYHTIKEDILKLNKSIEIENGILKDYSVIADNYKKILQRSKNNELREFEEFKR